MRVSARFWIGFCLLFFLMPSVWASHTLSVQGSNLLNQGTPLRGFMAHYGSTPISRAEVDATLDAMKNDYGLKGFSIDVGWSSFEPSRGFFTSPTMTEQVLDSARIRGMHVLIHLAPHYTPSWVYQQGPDVHMRNENGVVGTGNWLNYSPSSPAALQWQTEFQRTAVEYYKNKPAVIGFNLTNEMTYGKDLYLDYSSWANSAWQSWLVQRGLPVVSMPAPAEANARPGDWQNWQLFRQDQLNHYFNTTYTVAKSAMTGSDDEVIFHRHNWYAASESFSSKTGVYLDPALQNGADITGGNIYGMSPVQGAMLRGSRKPVFLTETTHPDLSTNSPTSPGALNAAMLRQFFEGAPIQTVFQFGGSNAYPMRNDDGTVHPAFLQFKQLTQIIDRVDETNLAPPREVGFIWPRNLAAVRSIEHYNVGGLHDEMLGTLRRLGETGITVFPSSFDSALPADPSLPGMKLIYALRHYGLDQATVNSDKLRDWVAAGGVLVVELDPNSAPPSWSGITASSSSRTAFSTAGGSPFGAQNNLQRGEVAWSLSGLDTVWGTWDKPTLISPTQNALGFKNYGLGKVIVSGTNAFTHSFDPVPGIGHYVFGDEALNESYDYYRIGHNVLVLPRAQSLGEVEIPLTWLYPGSHFYLMNLTSGEFVPTDFTGINAGRYVFDVPGNNLLLAITPEPSCVMALVAMTLLLQRRRRMGW